MSCNYVKQFRIKMNLTQEEVAERLNVTKQAVSKWESGKSAPTIDNLQEMAKIFSCKFEELVGREGEKVDWTSAWGKRYPILAEYSSLEGIDRYKAELEDILKRFTSEYSLSKTDGMLAVKDMLYQIYKNK